MKTYFGARRCESCQTEYDVTVGECPRCHRKNPDERVDAIFGHHVHAKWGKQLALFLTGLVGLYLIAIVVTIFFEIPFLSSHPGATEAEISEYMKAPNINIGVTTATYVVLLMVLCLILWSDNKKLFASFAKAKPYLIGLLGIAVLFAFSFFYSALLSLIYQAAGRPLPSGNANESGIRTLTTAFPVLAFLVFGVIGPFCEELTYRIGLFGFSARIGRAAAYIITALVFGFMHFGWSSITNPTYDGQLIDEIALIPPYIFAGLAFAFLYDRYGLCASLVAHVGNNLLSLTLTLVQR